MRDWNSITYDRYLGTSSEVLKVGHGILDISRDIDSEFLRKRTFDMTFWMINQSLKMNYGNYRGYSDSVKEILSNSLDNGDEICIIQCQGMMSLRLAHIVSLSLTHFRENPDRFVLGHIMNRNGRYPGLHRQMLIVNLKVWDSLGRPEYLENAVYWDRQFVGQNFVVSDNKIAAEYTPEFIIKSDGEDSHKITEDGANWIDLALRNNIQVDNLNLEMRECKCFIYPYDESEKLEHVWKNLQDMDQVDSLSNYSARAWMRKLSYQEFIEKDRVYAFNTERLSAEGIRCAKPVDHGFFAAAGFKPLALLRNNQFHDKTVVNYFDWCPASLNFKKHLLATWDGYDLDKWLIEHDNKYNFSSTYRGTYLEFWQKELDSEFGTPDEFKELWDRYRKLEHHFHIIDIVNEPEKLFTLITSCEGEKVLWTTNIWASMQLHWALEPEVLEEKFKNFAQLCPTDIALYGQDYMARELAKSIKEGIFFTHPKYHSNNKYINLNS